MYKARMVTVHMFRTLDIVSLLSLADDNQELTPTQVELSGLTLL